MSGPSFGYCPVDRDWSKESSGNPQTGRDWVRAPPNMPHFLDDTDNVMSHLASKKINAFSGIAHGFYFWNFRTDLNNPQWSYMLALERGWIPKGNLGEDKILNACHADDSGLFRCILKKHIYANISLFVNMRIYKCKYIYKSTFINIYKYTYICKYTHICKSK